MAQKATEKETLKVIVNADAEIVAQLRVELALERLNRTDTSLQTYSPLLLLVNRSGFRYDSGLGENQDGIQLRGNATHPSRVVIAPVLPLFLHEREEKRVGFLNQHRILDGEIESVVEKYLLCHLFWLVERYRVPNE